jgi:CheY-like chemotaxis protein
MIGRRRKVPVREKRRSVSEVSPLRILIVEDNRDSADSLKTLLEALRYDAHVVYDGETGVQSSATLRPDVIVMDIGLPGISGYEAARQIRARNPDGRPTIVALTGWGQHADRQQSAQAGIDHHLVKPLDLAALKQILDSLPQPATR